ncbi:hypothetical protein K449DRAFT_384492 [Hypoxylon sp. EC38]|nr:hypothetical protein K449DRAFT_384492 [Hypoxylon sp. EC38]
MNKGLAKTGMVICHASIIILSAFHIYESTYGLVSHKQFCLEPLFIACDTHVFASGVRWKLGPILEQRGVVGTVSDPFGIKRRYACNVTTRPSGVAKVKCCVTRTVLDYVVSYLLPVLMTLGTYLNGRYWFSVSIQVSYGAWGLLSTCSTPRG